METSFLSASGCVYDAEEAVAAEAVRRGPLISGRSIFPEALRL